ncbi:MAG: yhfK 1 [Patescibacteria group bacterium]|nr:yhfK 1 [Patescibacteria group bacterium]
MNILILGATGSTGKELLSQALESGHKVTALVRTPAKLTIDNANLRVLQGDATDVAALTDAMAHNEVLLSALGAAKGSLIADSTKAIIAAAKATGLKRVVMMSSFAVNRAQLKGAAKLLTGMMKGLVADKANGEALLKNSGLDWTIVYATILTGDAKGAGARVVPSGEKLSLSNKIARADVAAWMLGEIRNNSYVKKDVTISR